MKTKDIFPYLICVILGFFLFKECNRENKPETIIKEVSVKVPEIKKQFDTVFVDRPVRIVEVDTIYLKEYVNASDEEKEALFIDAVTVRDYYHTFEDENQAINVSSQVRGHLLTQSVDYTIFERKVTTKDTFDLPMPQRKLYFLPEIGSNIRFDGIKVKAGLIYQDRKEHLYKLSYDSEGVFWLGYGIKF